MNDPDEAKADKGDSFESITVARLIPVGRDTEDVFSQVVEYDRLSEYHRQYIHAKPRPLSPEVPTTSSPTDSDNESDRPSDPWRQTSEKLWSGHYLLSTHRPGGAKQALSWRVGKGTSKLKDRGVDLLVTCPGKYSYDVAMVHALIQFHPESGVLMLRGLSDAQFVEYELDKTKLLYAKDTHVLYQRENRFNLGKLRFNLEYETLDDEEYTKYIELRNQGLIESGIAVPHPKISAIPQRPHVRIDDLILHDNLSSGAFGFVCAAVDAHTGAPMAMKETWIRNKSMVKDRNLAAEVEVSEAFKVCSLMSMKFSGLQEVMLGQGAEGLLQANFTKCQHGHSLPCGAIPERFYLAFPLALHDFSRQKWSETPLPLVLSLLEGPLQGLKTLHEAGYMHRDVSAKNLLVMSLHPPRAVLCDYGKARRAKTHTDSHIGPIPTLAPEVHGQTPYDNKIDVWGIGYICCWILFPQFQVDHAHGNKPPDRSWHNNAMAHISEYERNNSGALERGFADLVRRMLTWSPRHRISAAEALQHYCMHFDPSSRNSSPDKEARAAKTQKMAHEAKIVPAASAKVASPKLGQQLDYHSGDTELLSSGARPPA